jgi:hypothetical protein
MLQARRRVPATGRARQLVTPHKKGRPFRGALLTLHCLALDLEVVHAPAAGATAGSLLLFGLVDYDGFGREEQGDDRGGVL